MSWSNRLMNKIDNRIDHSISMSNPIASVRQTTINGYRSLHLTEIYRFGVGAKNSVDLTINDDTSDNPFSNFDVVSNDGAQRPGGGGDADFFATE